jgi:hypothetical protein
LIVYQHPGLMGLEIWHGLARHTTLDQLRDDKPAYYAGLAEFLTRLHAGAAENAEGESLSDAAGFTELLVAGGEAAPLAFPHRLLPPDPFCARRGAEAIWAEFGWRRPVAIDLGQTQLKLMTPSASLVFPRRLPYGRAALPEAEGRERLRAFVGEALAAAGPYDGVVLGLPIRISAEGVAESSTYPGLYGPVEDVFGRMDWVVVNDAVLTARGYPPADGTKRLVMTMGFGVGAALWHG